MNDARTGVVLSGGGANGAYEVGVLKALLAGRSPATDYRPIDPEIYTGTSVGSFNAVMMASHPELSPTATVEILERLWLERIANTLENCGNGVYRLRGLPFQGLDPGCFTHPVETVAQWGLDAAQLAVEGLASAKRFLGTQGSIEARLLSTIDVAAFISESPFKQLLNEVFDPDGLRRSPKTVTIVASNWELGIPRLFSKLDLSDGVGPTAVLASTAMPGLFPPVEIDGVPYVDGGVLLNTPLKLAVDDGASILHVIFLDPLLENIPFNPLQGTLDTFYRLFAILWAVQVRADLAVAEGITRTLELLERGGLEAQLQSSSLSARRRHLLRQGLKVITRELAGAPYRKLEVHVYRPQTELGGLPGLLDFHGARMAELVALGYQDAISHDCSTAGCVRLEFPGEAPLPEEET